MKYTNIKKLLIKFMGGGLINFPTRFLRWVKIDGDAEGDNGGGNNQNINVLNYFPFDFSDDKPIGFVILKNWEFNGNDFPDGVDSRTYKYVVDNDVVIHPMEDLTNKFYQQYRIDNNVNYLSIVLLYKNYQENAVVVIDWDMQFAQYNNNTNINIYTRTTEYALINNGHIYYIETIEDD